MGLQRLPTDTQLSAASIPAARTLPLTARWLLERYSSTTSSPVTGPLFVTVTDTQKAALV